MKNPFYFYSEEKFKEKPNIHEKLKVFIILCGTSYSFHFFGNFYISEAILLVFFIDKFLKGKAFEYSGKLKNYNVFLILALVGEVISDLIRGSEIVTSLKGFSLILFTLINLNGLALLTRMNKSLIMYSFSGYASSGLISFIIQPSAYARTEVWKFGIGPSIVFLFLLFLSSQKLSLNKKLASILIACVSLLSLILGARSLALTIFISAYFVATNDTLEAFRKKRSLVKLLVVLFAFSFLFTSVYSKLAADGSLGIKAQSKYLSQTAGEGNLLVNSRSELIFATRAILESPIIGYGSYAIMSPDLKITILNFIGKLRIFYDLAPLYRIYGDRIPVHSMILQWWLWFGVLGLFFPIKILFTLIQTLRKNGLFPIQYFMSLWCIWALMFSPFGDTSRVVFPLAILICSFAQQETRTF